ncbi:hypothetical protein BDW66DRAFT_135270, partial [Aspergillus desertorum]
LDICFSVSQSEHSNTILVLIFGILSIEKGIMYMERSIVGCLCEKKLNLIW